MKPQPLRTLLRAHPRTLPAFVALGLVVSLAEALSIGLFVPILQEVLADNDAPPSGPLAAWLDAYAGLFPEEQRLAVLSSTVLVLLVVKALVTFAYTWMSERTSTRVTYGVRDRALRLLLDVDYAYVAQQRDGRLVDVVYMQAWRVGAVFQHLALVIVNACHLLIFVPVLLLVSWQLTLAAAAGMAVASAVVVPLHRMAERRGKRAVAQDQRVAAGVLGMLSSMRTLRAYGREDQEHARVTEIAAKDRDLAFQSGIAEKMVTPVMELLYAPLLLVVVAAAVHWELGAPLVLTSLALLYRMYSKFQYLHTERATLLSLLGAVEEVDDLTRADGKPFAASGNRRFDELSREIRFQDVSFRHAARARFGDKQVRADDDDSAGRDSVRGLDFTVEQGSLTAIVGRSGAGKSTVVNLLLRLFEPRAGHIAVDGVPLHELDLHDWRRAVAVAGQDTELSAGTIADNIRYGRLEHSDAQVEAAARKAAAHDFIAAMPQGYATPVGERGELLSAGQRQRIGLARALLASPSVLILDECTSALDNATAAAIDETVAALAGETTVVVIAHRTQSIACADKVVLLEQGEVVEQGDPEELRLQGGAFARLCAGEAPLDGDSLEASSPKP